MSWRCWYGSHSILYQRLKSMRFITSATSWHSSPMYRGESTFQSKPSPSHQKAKTNYSMPSGYLLTMGRISSFQEEGQGKGNAYNTNMWWSASVPGRTQEVSTTQRVKQYRKGKTTYRPPYPTPGIIAGMGRKESMALDEQQLVDALDPINQNVNSASPSTKIGMVST